MMSAWAAASEIKVGISQRRRVLVAAGRAGAWSFAGADVAGDRRGSGAATIGLRGVPLAGVGVRIDVEPGGGAGGAAEVVAMAIGIVGTKSGEVLAGAS